MSSFLQLSINLWPWVASQKIFASAEVWFSGLKMKESMTVCSFLRTNVYELLFIIVQKITVGKLKSHANYLNLRAPIFKRLEDNGLSNNV